MKPPVRVRHRIHGILILVWVLGPQFLPLVDRTGYVLNRVAAPDRIFGPEIERTEVDRIVRRAVNAMERDAHKTLLPNVTTPDIKLDPAIAKINPFQIRDAFAWG